jgi:hypothetical protein
MRDQITCDEYKYVVEMSFIECNAHVFSKRIGVTSVLGSKMHFTFIQVVKTFRSVIISPALTRTFTLSQIFNPNSSFGSSCFQNILFVLNIGEYGEVPCEC